MRALHLARQEPTRRYAFSTQIPMEDMPLSAAVMRLLLTDFSANRRTKTRALRAVISRATPNRSGSGRVLICPLLLFKRHSCYGPAGSKKGTYKWLTLEQMNLTPLIPGERRTGRRIVQLKTRHIRVARKRGERIHCARSATIEGALTSGR
jgi:hypothetical protein